MMPLNDVRQHLTAKDAAEIRHAFSARYVMLFAAFVRTARADYADETLRSESMIFWAGRITDATDTLISMGFKDDEQQ